MEIITELFALKNEYGDAFEVNFKAGFQVSVMLRSLVSKLDVEFNAESTILEINWTETGVGVCLKPEDGITDAEKLLTLLREKAQIGLVKGSISGILRAVSAFFSDASEEQTYEEQTYEEQTPSPISSPGSSALQSKYVADFIEIDTIAKGAFGAVFTCENKLDKMIYAVKKVPFSSSQEETVLREVRILCSAQHKNVVRYYQVWIEDEVPSLPCSSESDDASGSSSTSSAPTRTLYLLMEKCTSTLQDILEKGFDKAETWKYFRGIVEGLCHVHAQGIFHRDLSRRNIFLDESGIAKIGDFGLAVLVNTGDMAVDCDIVGDPIYQAPEIKNGSPVITNQADIYSLGLLLVEILYPMKTRIERDIVLNNFRKGTSPDDWNHTIEVTELVLCTLNEEPSERPTAPQILDTVTNW